MVAQTLGVPLYGMYWWRFNKALSKLTGPPPQKRRPRRRFTVAEGRLLYPDVFEQEAQG